MTKSQLIEKIREMPVAEQLELAESILKDHEPAHRVREGSRQPVQLTEAVNEALAYYQSDPDVALWSEMDAEPIHD